jgi:hypothetical protein
MRVVCRREPCRLQGQQQAAGRTGGRRQKRRERQRSRRTRRPPSQHSTTQRVSNTNNGKGDVLSLSHGCACEKRPPRAAPCCSRAAGLWPAFLRLFHHDRESTKHTNAPHKSIRITHHRRIQLVVYCACDCFVGWRRRLGRSAGLALPAAAVLSSAPSRLPALTHPQRRRKRQHGLILQHERAAAT